MNFQKLIVEPEALGPLEVNELLKDLDKSK